VVPHRVIRRLRPLSYRARASFGVIHTRFAAPQQSHSHDSTHPKHKTRCSIPRHARLCLSGRDVAHDDPRGADALARDGGGSPSHGHAPAAEAALRGQSLDPVAADAPPAAEQGPNHAKRTEPSSAATRPRLLCAGAAATRLQVNPAQKRRGGPSVEPPRLARMRAVHRLQDIESDDRPNSRRPRHDRCGGDPPAPRTRRYDAVASGVVR
jgi:hypothetical protein